MNEQNKPTKKTIQYSALNQSIAFNSAVNAARKTSNGRAASRIFIIPVTFIFISSFANTNKNKFIIYSFLSIIAAVLLYYLLLFVNGKRYVLMSSFAKDNGFEYFPTLKQKLNGIFDPISSDGELVDVIKGEYFNKKFWLGTYRYNANSVHGKKGLQEKTVISFDLQKYLPNIVLDSKSNNYFGMEIPVELARSQALELEGDFQNYFTLYVPRNYEREVLYFLTPELMAKIIDECQEFEIEIIGNELRFYSNKPLKATKKELSKIFDIYEKVCLEFADNIKNYKSNLADLETQFLDNPQLKHSLRARMNTLWLIFSGAVIVAWCVSIFLYFFRST